MFVAAGALPASPPSTSRRPSARVAEKTAAKGKPTAKGKPAAKGKPDAKGKPAVKGKPATVSEPALARGKPVAVGEPAAAAARGEPACGGRRRGVKRSAARSFAPTDFQFSAPATVPAFEFKPPPSVDACALFRRRDPLHSPPVAAATAR